ncbi:MAG: transposase [Candidatus Bathyarchaeia archaeon]|jgi:transposase
MNIPEIVYYFVVLMKSEIGDPCWFPLERLCSYAGLVSSPHSSGKIVRYGGITKKSSRWLSGYGCGNSDKSSQV